MEDHRVVFCSRIHESIRLQEQRWIPMRIADGQVPAVVFAPSWSAAFPAIHKPSKFKWLTDDGNPSLITHLWLAAAIDLPKNQCKLLLSVYQTSDLILRTRVINRLVEDEDEFGLSVRNKAGANIARLFTETIFDKQPIPASAAVDVRYKLDEAWTRWAGIPAALQPIFDDWKQSRF